MVAGATEREFRLILLSESRLLGLLLWPCDSLSPESLKFSRPAVVLDVTSHRTASSVSNPAPGPAVGSLPFLLLARILGLQS